MHSVDMLHFRRCTKCIDGVPVFCEDTTIEFQACKNIVLYYCTDYYLGIVQYIKSKNITIGS